MRKQCELNEFIIQGTILDRRRKTTAGDRKRIVNLYKDRKTNGLNAEKIASMYGLHVSNVYRYVHYDRFLTQCRNNSSSYNNKHKNTKVYKQKQRRRHKNLVKYKEALLDVREQHSSIEFEIIG